MREKITITRKVFQYIEIEVDFEEGDNWERIVENAECVAEDCFDSDWEDEEIQDTEYHPKDLNGLAAKKHAEHYGHEYFGDK